MKLPEHISPEQWQRVKALADTRETPFLVIDLENIREKYLQLVQGFTYAQVYYAVKANPADEVIALLNELGSKFDIASTYELDKVMKHGVSPERISFGNTIKKARDIRYFHDRG
ncbi:hypothetical protein [Marinobacterium aestuariivivens]|uniref:Orn/DAP/Arg decarboxylase 2 N-terminal domain-containing protein n=1 Tax=Marinobacterium aestuariivivens TaxID=1698799 RepID=A0ABW2A489_9GAMM